MSLSSNVLLCGENPEIRLYHGAPEDENEIGYASYWRCTYTPLGVGQVLIVWAHSAPHADLDGQAAIYSDVPAVGRYVADMFVQHFPNLARLNLRDVEVRPAGLMQTGDPLTSYRLTCATDTIKIEARWDKVLDIRPPRLYSGFTGGRRGTRRLQVQNVICPVETASIRINGERLPGDVVSFHDGQLHRSTAFLAFSETWMPETESELE